MKQAEATRLQPRDRLIVALDLPSVEAAQAMVSRLGDAVSFYKIGYQLAFAGGLGYAQALAGAGQRVRVRQAAGEGELIADLVERHRVAEPRHHGLRLFDRGHVERDDQPVAGLHLHRSILRDG